MTENISKHLLAPEYRLSDIDHLYEVSHLPIEQLAAMAQQGNSDSAIFSAILSDTKEPVSKKITIPTLDGKASIELLVFRPTDADANTTLPIVYFMHGGGYLLGNARTIIGGAHELINDPQAIVVSVNYRLATQAPYPADIQDAYAGLEYVYDHAAELGGDSTRIVIAGESAGGGLAARLALYNRDKGRVPLLAQVLTYPMLDCRTGTDKQVIPDLFAGEYIWTPAFNRAGWTTLLGGQTIPENEMQYYSAAFAKDVSKLPPALITVGSLDLFCMESLTYAQRMIASGVNVELHTVPGVFHGFDGVLPDSPQTRCYIAKRSDFIRRKFSGK